MLSPDAGTLIPYEYTIALAENAVDNGVEARNPHRHLHPPTCVRACLHTAYTRTRTRTRARTRKCTVGVSARRAPALLCRRRLSPPSPPPTPHHPPTHPRHPILSRCVRAARRRPWRAVPTACSR
jgi:hypothetical protein